MKLPILIISVLSFYSCSDNSQKSKNEKAYIQFTQKTRLVDTSFVNTVKLNDIIVCSTTITDIKKMGYLPVVAPQAQIDSITDAVNWLDGQFYYDKTKSLLFSTYKETELLTSVIIKNNFTGTLRELPIADFSRLTVRDITTYFKDLHWSTTDVSKYWIYGNDTVNFYVRVDTSIPRFPLNEKFYADKHPAFAKIQFVCSKIYGDEYAKQDTVIQKPLYAPLSDPHLNYYLLRRKPGFATTIKQITSTGKKTILEEIRIGKWVTYHTDHSIESVAYYKDGKFVSPTSFQKP